MENIDFKKLLFKCAFCTMACDGEIHPDEIKELQLIDKNTPYFKNIDLSDELKYLTEDLKKNGKKVIESLFNTLRKTKLEPGEELQILEVVLRIIESDKRWDDNEIKFLKIIRSKLDVHNEIIIQRFGKIKYLTDNMYYIQKQNFKQDFLKDIKMPDLKNVDKINLNLKNN